MKWKNKTCQDCVFRVNCMCRLNPPSIEQPSDIDDFPVVAINLASDFRYSNPTSFSDACSHWSDGSSPGFGYGDEI